MRYIGLGHGGGITYRDLGGIDGAELDELIARQVRVFAERGEEFEWKLHGHDQPPDLRRATDRTGLRARGDRRRS